MEYKYTKPEKISFEQFTEEFIPDFDQVDEAAKQKALTYNVWAYGICHPFNGLSPWGATYTTSTPCIPT
jgi:hypothetical protein